MSAGMYVDVLVPVPVSGTFLYRIPESFHGKILPGIRVVVPFGKSKTYTGLVTGIHQEHPANFTARNVLAVLDKVPLVTDKHLRFWKWISDYYLCSEGEIMDAALPAGLKPVFRQRLTLSPRIKDFQGQLTEEEYAVITLLHESGPCTTEEIFKHAGTKKLAGKINELTKKGLILAEDYLEQRYKPRQTLYLSLNPDITGDEKWNGILDSLSAAPRQKEILLFFLEHRNEEKTLPAFEKSVVLKLFPAPGAVRTLVKKDILKETEKEVSRLAPSTEPKESLFRLNKVQTGTMRQIEDLFKEKDIVLLHGITSSGKTELYFHLIRKVVDQRKQVLYLLPEIAITTQMIRRLQRVFGSKVAVFHSRYSDNERVETWLEVSKHAGKGSVSIVLGVRSAIFLPFRNLGLIIIDEEHETTYKQQNPAPRYHARDMAVVLAQIHGAKVILGTATPSIETYYNARTGKYGLAELNERFTKVELPRLHIVDMKKTFRRGEAKGHLSAPLHKAIMQALNDKEQIILFQNRRGFSPFVQCNHCGWIPYCRHCDVRLTYHRQENRLECHYCGYSESPPHECPRCRNTDIRTRGFGTEKVEDEITLLFPSATILRLDLDTARTKSSYEKIIRQFEERRADILIGTQMVTKGLDFTHVQVVGILNADNLLHFPDFRAWERSFQLITQVSGRAGRLDKQGTVFIQTWDPEHPVLRDIVNYDYLNMYQTQLQERKDFGYPPYYRLIRVHLRHRKPGVVNHGATLFAEKLRKTFPGKVLGPEPPVIPRIRNLWEKQILLKINRDANLRAVKQQVTGTGEWMKKDKTLRSIRVIYDVDPV